MEYGTVKASSNSHGFVDVHTIEQKWKDMFTYLYRLVYTLLVHIECFFVYLYLLIIRISILLELMVRVFIRREEREQGFCFPITIHPDVSGRPRKSFAPLPSPLSLLLRLLPDRPG
jgi:hypothetical protein